MGAKKLLSVRQSAIAGIVLLLSGAAILIVQAMKLDLASLFSVGYIIAVSLFLMAQIYGFIVSQTEVHEAVEAVKMDMLRAEEEEWG